MSFEVHSLQNVEGKLCSISAGIDSFNYGGLCELYVIEHNSVLTLPSVSLQFDSGKQAIASGDIIVDTDVEAYYFQFTPDTAGFIEKMDDNNHGGYYDQSLVITIPKDRPELPWLKYKMSRGRYILIYRDNNGQTKIIGKIGKGLRVKFDLDTKKDMAGFNAHTMTARRSSLEPAIFWSLAADEPILDHITE